MAEMSDNFNPPDGWLDQHLSHEFSVSGQQDIDMLTDITADAFRDDPFNIWMFRDYKAMHFVFKHMVKYVYAPRGLCHRIGDEAAAMWMMPGVSRDLPAFTYPMIATAVLRHGGPKAVKRVLSFDKAVDPRHPNEPHAYLFTVGVRPNRQGRGLGKRLLLPVLRACDDIGLPVYLENSNPENRGFYGGLGFERTELFSVLPGGPPLEGMWRAAP